MVEYFHVNTAVNKWRCEQIRAAGVCDVTSGGVEMGSRGVALVAYSCALSDFNLYALIHVMY